MLQPFSPRHVALLPPAAIGFIPTTVEEAKQCFAAEKDGQPTVLVGYAPLAENACEVQLCAYPGQRGRWGNKAFWRDFYRIPFEVLGYRCMIARTNDKIVTS